MRTGVVHLPLHHGNAPRGLFSRMGSLSREIVLALSHEHGTAEVLRRLSDPFWFQAALRKAGVGDREKLEGLRRLDRWLMSLERKQDAPDAD